MVKVAGIWERGWFAPSAEEAMWMMLREFEVDEWIMTPVTGIVAPVTEYPNIDAVIDANPELQVVFLDENAETPLTDFPHPEDALYICGGVGFSPRAPSAMYLQVETPNHKGLLWGPQAMAIVLRDRWLSQ